MKWIEWLAEALAIVIQAIRDGATDEEIAARLSAPGSVGEHLLEASRTRKGKLAEYRRGGR